MQEDKFRLLLTVFKILEKNDSGNKNLEDAIIGIIDFFDDHVTDDQKKEMLKEFVRYEELRKSVGKRKAIFETIEYAAAVNDFISKTVS